MTTSRHRPALPSPPLVALAALSASAIAVQILLLRLFSIVQWHHFAWLVISLALLGYGAAGTFVTLAQSRLMRNPAAAIIVAMLAFAGAAVPAFLFAQTVSFNPEEMLWRPTLAWRVTLIYLSLAVPFLCAAVAIALSLRVWPERVGRIYAADLVGAGSGGVTALVLLAKTAPLAGLVIAAAGGAGAAVLAAWHFGIRTSTVGIAALVLVIGSASLAGFTGLRPSPYKDLSQALEVSSASVARVRHGTHGTVSVVDSPDVPPRVAPGLSLLAPAGPPPQLAAFLNGDFIGALTADTGDGVFTDWLPSALPYHLRRPERVLVPDAGTGLLALQARNAGVRDIHIADARRDLTDLIAEDYADFTGRLYAGEDIERHNVDSRAWVASTNLQFDLIQLPAAGALTGTGLQALAEDPLRTREQLSRFMAQLSEDGLLGASCWLDLPVRTCLRLGRTLLETLEAADISDPLAHIVAVRAWQLATFVVSPTPWAADEIQLLKAFARERAFDVVIYPGMDRAEANRVNQLDAPYLHDGLVALSGPHGEAFVADYPFDIRTVTDDRPFGTSFLRLGSLSAMGSLAGGGVSLIDAGPVLLGVALVQALIVSLLLLVLPLAAHRGAATRTPGWRSLVFFVAIGMAFMLLEMALLHRFSLFLADPVRSAAVVIAALLVSAGAGSAFTPALANRLGSSAAIRLGVMAVIALGLGLTAVLPLVTSTVAGWSPAARMGVAVLLIAPLGFVMGWLLPLGLSRLAGARPDAVPWAWAFNGCASVTGAIGASLVALAGGFTSAVVAALVLYGLAAACPPESGT